MSASADPLAVHCWDEYNDALYVKRSLDEELDRWLADRNQNRSPLLSLVGPPGVGKSWALANLHRKLLRERDKFVFLLDGRKLIGDHGTNHDEIKNRLISTATAHCSPEIFRDPYYSALPDLIETLMRSFCERCPNKLCVVLVDGCDDLVSEDDFHQIQREYLQRFFFTGSCCRMILARRLKLTDYTLKRLNVGWRVGTFTQKEAESQRQRLGLTAWPQLPNNCTYQWDHPYINCYLLNSARDRDITPETLEACCRSLIERAQPKDSEQRHYSQTYLERLRRIAKTLPPSWTSEQYQAQFKESFDDLADRSLISLDKENGPTYAIIDGLRQLLQALPE